MSTQDPEQIIPGHESGIQTNTESAATLPDEGAARSFFETVKARLFDVNRWQEHAGRLTAAFQLTDKAGKEADRSVQEGDYFRIDIPGPGPKTGDGYDWVQVEKVEEAPDCVVIRVRPASNPTNDRKDVAHFFSEETTSSFMVKRDGATVTAGVYGRNEKPNTNAEAAVDKARNAAVASGAISGFSKLQWKSLVNGLVQRS